jgi:hypothetical protein
MLCEHIVVTQAELNSGSGIIKELTDSTISSSVAQATGTWDYYPKSVQVTNGTGETIYFLPLTKVDYRGWASDNTITDLIPVADSTSKEITSMKGRIEYILCSGVAGSGHTSDLTLVVIKEN